ncbi:MAG: hypothetical protein U0235_19755 [Polyangiaceae bacterium]
MNHAPRPLFWSRLATLVLGGAALVPAGCTTSGFGNVASGSVLSVKITAGDRGKSDKRLPITFDAPARFTLSIEALKPDGKRDDSFDRFVHLSTNPGTVSRSRAPAPTAATSSSRAASPTT